MKREEEPKSMSKKVVVVGGGPGGYVAAIRAAQLGAEVQLVENTYIGGTCLNVGCIPTKALLHTAQGYQNALDRSGGLLAENVRVNWAAMMEHKGVVVRRLVQGTAGLLRSNGVKVYNGTAVLSSTHSVQVDGKETLEADVIVLATGSEPAKIPFPGANLEGVIDSTGALSLSQCPKSILILGGGVIGVEFAYLYRSLGAEVTVVEMLPEILPHIDSEISEILRKELEHQGVKVMTGTKMLSAEKNGENLSVKVSTDGKEKTLDCEKLLVAVGRRPKTANLGLESVGVATERGAIVTDEHFQTNINGIYAIGDCNAKTMLAHAASAQGVAAIEYALTGRGYYNGNVIPSCIYTQPEVGCVGMTETQAKAGGFSCQVGRFSLSGNGKSLIEGGESGLVKIVADINTHQILGAHMIGPRVTEIVGELALAINCELTVEDVLDTIHAHPTITEAVHEAAHAVFGNAIHWPPKKKR